MNASRAASYKGIIGSTSIVGGATLLSIVIGMGRVKLFALAAGAAGIGLIGVLTSILATATTLAGMGLGLSGVREIARSQDDGTSRLVSRALWIATWLLGVAGAAVVWLCSGAIVQAVIGSREHETAVALLSIGVWLGVVGATQVAVLQGHRRIADLARVKVYGAVISTLISCPLVYFGGYWGLVGAVLVMPLANALVAWPMLPYRNSYEGDPVSVAAMIGAWRALFSFGAAVMVAGTASAMGMVAVRAVLLQREGIESAGLYQAAFGISAANVGIILAAMSSDYFPRLSAIAQDLRASSTLIQDQLRISLLMAGPLLMGLCVAASAALWILYTKEFSGADDILRWHVLGDLVRLPGWALGFMIVARRDTALYLITEIGFVALYVAGTMVLTEFAGAEGAGLAYLIGYVVYSLLVAAICWVRYGVKLSKANVRLVALMGICILSTIILFRFEFRYASVIGVVLTFILSMISLVELHRVVGKGVMSSRVEKLILRLRVFK
jgi:PST family polysaccharide transporter